MRGESRLLIPPYYTAASLTMPLNLLSFWHLLSSYFPLAFTSYPLFQYYPFSASLQQCIIDFPSLTTSSSTHHSSFNYFLAGPKHKIRRHDVFDIGPTSAETQIPWALGPGAHYYGVLSITTLISLVGSRGFCQINRDVKRVCRSPPKSIQFNYFMVFLTKYLT